MSAGVKPRTAGPDGLPWSASAEELDRLASMPAEGTWHVGGERGEDVKLTNLDKVLFEPHPVDGGDPVTKRDLVRYFARIAPTLLPHLAERPLNLHRFPNGAGGQGFWQKDTPDTAPGWIRRWKEVGVEDRKANTHVIADRVATLCWLGNQAAFEVHAWTSRLEAPFRPTFALIDIDPGTSTTWEETLVLARLYRTALEHLGVRAYPKVTGQRGIQAWIPIEPKYSFSETSDWVEGISRAIGATVPDLGSWEWSKGSRGGRPASTTPRTSPSRRSSRHIPCGRPPVRRCRRRSAGTSSTTPICGRTAGRSGRSSSALTPSATCSSGRRRISRCCHHSADRADVRARPRGDAPVRASRQATQIAFVPAWRRRDLDESMRGRPLGASSGDSRVARGERHPRETVGSRGE
jgi:DNA ligase D-like protein (predicted polymerase)